MYVLARVEVRGSTSKTCDANHRESGKRPNEGPFVEVGENVVHESVDGEGDNVVGDVDQELVPAQGFVVLAGMSDIEIQDSGVPGMLDVPGSSGR